MAKKKTAKKTTKKTAKKASKKAARKRIGGVDLTAAPESVEASRPYPEPVPLDGVLGQSHAISLVRSALSAERVHHAWIFHGPEGVGKLTTAVALASMVLDPTTTPNLAGELSPEIDSHVQRLIRVGDHPDLHVIRRELAAVSREDRVRSSKQMSIPREVVMEFLVEPAARTRNVQGESLAAKVFIVDEAHAMGPEAQNALLKTLEEPPEGTLIILVTSHEDRLLPTIRSRCQRVGFVPLARTSMDEWLDRSGLEVKAGEGDWLLEYAAGSPGLLTSAHEGGFYAWHKTLDPLLEQAEEGQYVVELPGAIEKIIKARAEAIVEGRPNASKESANKAAVGEVLRLISERARRGVREGGGDIERRLAAIDATERARTEADRNVNLAFVADGLATRLAEAAKGRPLP